MSDELEQQGETVEVEATEQAPPLGLLGLAAHVAQLEKEQPNVESEGGEP